MQDLLLVPNCFTSICFTLLKKSKLLKSRINHTFSLPGTCYYIMLQKPTENFIKKPSVTYIQFLMLFLKCGFCT